MNVKELQDTEKPIFRLRYFGANHLSNQELVQILMGSDYRQTAEEILDISGGLSDIRKMTIEELVAISGIGEKEAARLVVAAELGVRIVSEKVCDRQHIVSADDVWEIFKTEFTGEKQEIVTALLLNVMQDVIGREMVSKGSMRSAQIEASDIFRIALKRGAAGVILIHNHPSGDPTPSADDIYTTKRISQCGDLIGIKLIDHIIIGRGRYASLRELNHMEFGDLPLSNVAEVKPKKHEKERERER
jgi:DNA repair protein RadC